MVKLNSSVKYTNINEFEYKKNINLLRVSPQTPKNYYLNLIIALK